MSRTISNNDCDIIKRHRSKMYRKSQQNLSYLQMSGLSSETAVNFCVISFHMTSFSYQLPLFLDSTSAG